MRRALYIVSLALLLLCSCKGRPGYVLDKEKLATVLADMHTAEVVVDMNHAQFSDDSTRMALKQSVLAHNKVDMDQFDTTLVWYGHNIEDYLEVYDRTIEILEARSAAVGDVIAQGMLSMSGDSIDIWPAARTIKISSKMPSRMVTFDLLADSAEEAGDTYHWRIKLVDSDASSVEWAMIANYSDSTIAYNRFNTSQDRWNEFSMTTDSTKMLKRLRGYFRVTNPERDVVWVDSISLIRKAPNPQATGQYYNRPRTYKEY